MVLDLIQKVAHLADESTASEFDAEAWYRHTFGRPPNYSDLLDQTAKTTAERSQLLRGYFEPTAEKREQGRKLPTDAHRAIAELVSSGYVRVIVTTNFDRLLEQALEAAGVRPAVIASPDAIRGALPLTHSACTVVKLHGDYLDTRLRNTLDELARYPGPVNRLLDQIVDEYGLIVCGWSAEYDIALRAALERRRSRRFATYWTFIRPPKDEARRLMEHVRAVQVPITDADNFFRKLVEDVKSLEELATSHPLSPQIAEASLKRYLVDDRHRILLHDLVMNEANRVRETLANDGSYSIGLGLSGAEIARQLPRYEALSEVLMKLFATGCYWGEAGQIQLWVRALNRLASLPVPSPNATQAGFRINLHRYPAMLALYAGGIAAVAAGRYDTLAALLTGCTIADGYRTDVPMVLGVNPYRVMEIDVAKTMPGLQNGWLPFNQHVCTNARLREAVGDLLPDEQEFEAKLDWFEYLLGLVHVDLAEKVFRSKWAPVSCFVWRGSNRYWELAQMAVVQEVTAEIEADGTNWPLLRAGLFDGSLERLSGVMTHYHQSIAMRPH